MLGRYQVEGQTMNGDGGVIGCYLLVKRLLYVYSCDLQSCFTEQGVAIISGILNSGTAINMNIAIKSQKVFVNSYLKHIFGYAKKIRSYCLNYTLLCYSDRRWA